MSTEEDLEQEVEQLKETLSQIEDLGDDADEFFHQAFANGYENLETKMDKGFNKLNEVKSLL